jgi:hypothetical protein
MKTLSTILAGGKDMAGRQNESGTIGLGANAGDLFDKELDLPDNMMNQATSTYHNMLDKASDLSNHFMLLTGTKNVAIDAGVINAALGKSLNALDIFTGETKIYKDPKSGEEITYEAIDPKFVDAISEVMEKKFGETHGSEFVDNIVSHIIESALGKEGRQRLTDLSESQGAAFEDFLGGAQQTEDLITEHGEEELALLQQSDVLQGLRTELRDAKAKNLSVYKQNQIQKLIDEAKAEAKRIEGT